ncbi:MAG: hypothetical protein K0R38_4130 [Polyangiaceae bacterium]|jgi:thioester reductase-like protein|nr:hypothetical protein [Polyangiaceae bacterium]
MRYEPIAIIGMSGRFPEAENLDELWSNLASGRDSIRQFPESRRREVEDTFGPMTERYVKNGYLSQIADFDAGYFGISAEEARFMDPQQRIALELLEEAIQDSGYRPAELAKATVSTYIAHASNQYGTLLANHPMSVVNVLDSALAGRVAYIYDFRGPAITVNTACSSSLVALHMACVSLLTGESDYSVVAGCQVFPLPAPWQAMKDYPVFAKSEQLRAFARGADGTLGGEGGGAFILKKLSRALADGDVVHAVVRGSGVNSDAARSNGLSAPSHVAQAELITQVLRTAELTVDEVGYVEAHGTGTELGDPIEVEGIAQAFKGRSAPLPIGSVKTNIGHLVGMAGFAGAAKVVLALQKRKLPPSLHFDEPNPHIDFEKAGVFVNARLADFGTPDSVLRAGVSSFGIIGTNAHAIFEQAPLRNATRPLDEAYAVPVSAQSRDGLTSQLAQLERRLGDRPSLSIEDVAYTLATGRRALRHRACFVVGSVSELRSQLVGRAPKPPAPGGGVLYVCAPSSLERPSSLMCAEVERRYTALAGGVQSARAQRLLRDYAHAQALASAGCGAKGVIGWGSGRYLANLVSGKTSVAEALAALAAEGDQAHEDERLIEERARSAVDKGYTTLLFFGDVTPVFDRLQDYLGSGGAVHRPTADSRSFLASLGSAFEAGADIRWHELFGSAGRRVSLPPTPLERQRHFALKSNLRRDLFPEPGATRAAEARPSPTSEEASPGLERASAAPSGPTLADAMDLLRGFLPAGASEDADFLSNGGDSIGIVECSSQIQERYGVELSVDDFYEAQTLRQLGELVVARSFSGPDAVDAGASAGSVVEAPPAAVLAAGGGEFRIEAGDEPDHVLVTGATGYLGAHVVRELATSSRSVVHCLVRGESESQARQRLEQRLRLYFGAQLDTFARERLLVVKGDVRQERLGVEDAPYLELCRTISNVIHSAADVRQVAPAEQLRAANVDGTRRVIELCRAVRSKRLQHCSTYVVSGRVARPTTFAERDLEQQQSFLGNTYARTKYEAEQLVNHARATGLRANVFRIGNLTGRLKDGVFQANASESLLYASFSAIMELRSYPQSLSEMEVELSPVDLCAQALVRLMARDPASSTNFHLMNPRPTRLGRVFSAMESAGLPLRKVERDDEFRDELSVHASKAGSPDTLKKLWLLLDGGRQRGASEPSFQPQYTFEATLPALGEVGFAWPELGSAYFSKLVDVLQGAPTAQPGGC